MVYATTLIKMEHALNVVPDVLTGGPQQGSAQHLFYFVAQPDGGGGILP